MRILTPTALSPRSVFWTAFVGLFFDYYDLYLFVYLEKVLATDFGLTVSASNGLQFTGMAGVGLGALVFGWLADRYGRGPIMLAVFGAYVLGVAGISVAWDFESLLGFRLLASLALGAEWGISHAFMSEHVGHENVTGSQRSCSSRFWGGCSRPLCRASHCPMSAGGGSSPCRWRPCWF